MKYHTALLKLKIELVIISPIILLGRLAGKLFPLKTKHDIFLFIPSPDIGGSIKVNADIANCIQDKKPLIIFTKRPKNAQFKHLFDIEGVRTIDLYKYIDNKFYHFVNIFFRGLLASWINKIEKPVIFGGECLFFYKIIPHVKKETRKVELCHLNTWINFSLAFIRYIDYRVFSTQKIKRDIEKQYRDNNLPQLFFERLYFIDNKVNIPDYHEITNPILQVLFVGRGSPQKRVHLIGEIAKRMHEAGSPAHFSFVGDVNKIIPLNVQPYCSFYGNVKEEQTLNNIYMQSDVLLISSAYEGLPIAVMEAMARGKVVVSTSVDGIPNYISHENNGLLILEIEEEKIVERGIELLELLINNPELKKKIGRNSYEYALNHFSEKYFCKAYRELLINKNK